MGENSLERGSYTIEASIYVPMMLLMILVVLQGGIRFYQESRNHSIYEELEEMNTVQEFYIYQMIGEIGEDWIDD